MEKRKETVADKKAEKKVRFELLDRINTHLENHAGRKNIADRTRHYQLQDIAQIRKQYVENAQKVLLQKANSGTLVTKKVAEAGILKPESHQIPESREMAVEATPFDRRTTQSHLSPLFPIKKPTWKPKAPSNTRKNLIENPKASLKHEELKPWSPQRTNSVGPPPTTVSPATLGKHLNSLFKEKVLTKTTPIVMKRKDFKREAVMPEDLLNAEEKHWLTADLGRDEPISAPMQYPNLSFGPAEGQVFDKNEMNDGYNQNRIPLAGANRNFYDSTRAMSQGLVSGFKNDDSPIQRVPRRTNEPHYNSYIANEKIICPAGSTGCERRQMKSAGQQQAVLFPLASNHIKEDKRRRMGGERKRFASASRR